MVLTGETQTARVARGTLLNGIYAIDALIAEGGMGEVYRGHNVQTDDAVAIKLLQPWLSDNPDALALFRREASVLHRLSHDAIVRTYVFSVDPALGRAYLAMEFVEGVPLSRRLEDGPLDPDELDVLRRRLADALATAHHHGVIHRDVAPDNVLLPGGKVARAKLIDFGIARNALDGDGTIIGGGFAGKYAYVSPEQLGLAGGEVSGRSDVYSLGLVLAEAALGRPLDMGRTPALVIENRRTVPDLDGVPPTLRPLLERMLQPHPADRPDSAAVAAWRPEAAGESAPRPVTTPPSAAPAAATPEGETAGAAQGAADTGHQAATVRRVAIAASVVAAAALAAGVMLLAPPDRERSSEPPPLAAIPAPATTAPEAAAVENNLPENTLPERTLPAAPPPAAESAPPAPSETADSEVPPSGTTGAESASRAPPNTSPPAIPAQQPVAPAATATPPAAPRPASVPRAPYRTLTLATAEVDAPYRAALPGFTDGIATGRLHVRLDGRLPAGLDFRDLGSGFSEIVGTPRQVGSAAFALVARNEAGNETRMEITLPVVDSP